MMNEELEIRDPKPARREKLQIKSRLKNLLMFLPNMAMLLGRLLTDKRVPKTEKALLLGAIVYFISPIDLIPDFIPFIGELDDAYVIVLVILRLINRTDERVVRENWSGGGDIVSLANSIAGLAPVLLPRRVSRVLSEKVNLPSAGEALGKLTKNKKAKTVEIEPQQNREPVKIPSPS
jgi:uncharacterized membrane protein YkvA (DUF1232 family)